MKKTGIPVPLRVSNSAFFLFVFISAILIGLLDIAGYIFNVLFLKITCLLGILWLIVQSANKLYEKKRASSVKIAEEKALLNMSRLQEISTKTGYRLETHSLLREMIYAAINITNADMGYIESLDETTGSMKILAHYGFKEPFLDFLKNSPREHSNQRIVTKDILQSPLDIASIRALLEAGVRAYQATPFFSRSGKLLGIFSTHYKMPFSPDESDLKIIDLLSRQAADLIEQKQNERAIEERTRYETLLSDIAVALISTPNTSLNEIIRDGLKLLVEFMGVDMANFSEFSRETGAITLISTYLQPDIRQQQAAPGKECNLKWWADQLFKGKPVIIESTEKLPEEAQEKKYLQEAGIRSYIGIPMVSSGEVIGAISLASLGQEKPWTKETFSRLKFIGDVFTVAVTRKQMEETLRVNAKKYRNLFKNMDEGVALLQIIYDSESKPVDYIFSDVNPKYESIIRADENITGKKASVFYGGAPPYMDFFGRIEATGEPAVFETSFENLEKNYRISAFSPEKGRVAVIFSDITEQKLAARLMLEKEEILKRDKETLEKLVMERTDELINSYKEMEKLKRLSDLGELAATVAHELRNPLAAINLANYNLQKKIKSPELSKHFTTISRKITEGNAIINNLLSFSKMKLPNYENINIFEVLDETIEMAKQKCEKKNISIINSLENLKNVTVEADPFQLKGVFINILNNACESMTDNGRIEITGELEGIFLKLFFKDNGAGIDRENVNKVFEPFFSTKSKGTGLGLSVCRQIINMHNGKIKIESEKGKGTTVTVTLPLRKPETGAS